MDHVVHLSKTKMECLVSPNERIRKMYELSSGEFLAFIQSIGPQNDYKNRVKRLIERLNRLMGISDTPVVLTIPNKYYTSDWGRLYWTFFHIVSILIEYYIETRQLNDTLDLPLLIYNVDQILYCSLCYTHYTSIKNTDAIKDCIKRIAFGFTISGVMDFHNIITNNIYMTDKKHKKQPRQFSVIDMAVQWQAIEDDSNIQEYATMNDYLRPHVDWQTEIHTALSILCALKLKIRFTEASKIMKTEIYTNDMNKMKIDELFFDLVSMKEDVVSKIHEGNLEFYYFALRFIYLYWYDKYLKDDFERRLKGRDDISDKQLKRIQDFAKSILQQSSKISKDSEENKLNDK